ncbi:unnamed protein product [Cuscuta epithymum]|uniref:Ankyrin repeat domain-containing protein n=2 Tax=Cuscuta epithymum TaxID=186058 RepID=A0AAV0FCT4_9ASTE|nr:unnamed protein product [Cuscuta epithymum]
MDQFSNYVHSPAHLAVAKRDHAALEEIVSSLPRLAKAGAVNNEAESLAAENDADIVSAVIDRRDVHGRETPLHLAVKMRDPISAEILMSAGADWSLQNDKGWSALQEAVCLREENIAKIIARHYQPLAWAKWCRRLPRIVASASRIRDFYMEITFHFESSVLPFIGKIAPSDTYRIWKRGANLRADMTLAGFDSFHIQRSDQTFLFLGKGYDGNICSNDENGKIISSLPPGSLIVLSHPEKEITNALEGAGVEPTEAEVWREVKLMCKTNMYRPGIDVTQAELVPHMNWMRRHEKTEMVGVWKARVYDMLHVMVSVKSRRVPGAVTDEELFTVDEGEDGIECDVLTEEERVQLENALRGENSDDLLEYEEEPSKGCSNNKEKKSWLGWNSNSKKKSSKYTCPEDEKQRIGSDNKKSKHDDKSSKKKKKKGQASSEGKNESEYKKGLRPVLWLTPDFPLRTEELLPLLDILANKVKAVRRLREVLTTKLPPGTFPVKIAVPIVPTIRVVVTFTKFEELQPLEEFSTPPSSPTHFQDSEPADWEGPTVSWASWLRGVSRDEQSSSVSESCSSQNDIDPFQIPSDYTWVDANEKKRRRKAAKKAKLKKNKKHSTTTRCPDGVKAEA